MQVSADHFDCIPAFQAGLDQVPDSVSVFNRKNYLVIALRQQGLARYHQGFFGSDVNPGLQIIPQQDVRLWQAKEQTHPLILLSDLRSG